jgi:ferrous iron transport protein A
MGNSKTTDAGVRGSSLLADLPIGARARVSSILGNDELSGRLMEMGLTPGVEVAMIGAAPLGDPVELELRGYRLSVRRSEAARVEVRV